jgi:hypothetical protein
MPCQQDDLYRAEQGVPVGRSFETQPEMQKWVDDLHNRLWHNHEPWGDEFPNVVRIEAYFKSRGSASLGGFKSDCNCGLVEMLPCHRNELILCHEIAHVLARARYGSCSHDPWFARTYLNLVYSAMGSETFYALWTKFKAAGIDIDID